MWWNVGRRDVQQFRAWSIETFFMILCCLPSLVCQVDAQKPAVDSSPKGMTEQVYKGPKSHQTF